MHLLLPFHTTGPKTAVACQEKRTIYLDSSLSKSDGVALQISNYQATHSFETALFMRIDKTRHCLIAQGDQNACLGKLNVQSTCPVGQAREYKLSYSVLNPADPRLITLG